MQDEFCELRFDIPLPPDADPRRFERGWRDVLAAQRLTALAVPPAQAVAARFRVCGPAVTALERYLPARLAALPGAPAVAAETTTSSPDWQGVKIWLSYRSQDLNTLLQKSKMPNSSRHNRGRR